MSTYSTNLALELIGTGEQAGVWGTTTNTNLGTLIEQAISGYVTQAVATGTDTTITIPNGATGVARNMYIELTGTGGTNTNLIVPANKKLYFIFNNSTGAVTVKVSGQTGVSVPQGKKVVLTSNGTDIVNGLNYIADFGSNSATITQLTATSATITNLTLTSLVISNLSIASANITTLTATNETISGNLTLSGGTANGVLYLNGSKVATSGSALQYDGTTMTLTATDLPRVKFTGSTGGGDGWIDTFGTSLRMVNNHGSGTTRISGNGTIEIYTAGGSPITFSTAAAEQMRLNSTGLGIGTASPGYKLDVRGVTASGNGTITTGFSWDTRGLVGTFSNHGLGFLANGTVQATLDTSGNLGIGTASPGSYLSGTAKLVALANANSQNSILVRNDSAGSSASCAIALNASGNTWGIECGSTAKNNNALTFQLDYGGANSTLMTLNTSGNLGLGVTPSAWGSGFKAIEGAYGQAFAYDLNVPTTRVVANAFNDGSWKYKISSFGAGRYDCASGAHQWFTAPSGTAGNTISFTQAMTLDANGVLLRGNTTARSTNALGAGQMQVEAANFSAFQMFANANSTDGSYMGLWKSRGGALGGTTIVQNGDLCGAIYFGGYDGTTAQPAAYIGAFVDGTPGASDMPGRLTFSTTADGSINPVERGRFTAGGYFKASNTGTYNGATGTYHEFYQTANSLGLLVRATNASYTDSVVTIVGDRTTTNSTYNLIDAYNGNISGRFTVRDSGNAVNTNGSYGTISDAKMKTDIVDAGSQWDDIKAVRFRKFKMKDDPSGITQLGVVAQELEQTSPGLVDEHADKDAEGNDLGTTTKSVKSSILLMKAAVALQEAMARIETLEAKVAALEAK